MKRAQNKWVWSGFQQKHEANDRASSLCWNVRLHFSFLIGLKDLKTWSSSNRTMCRPEPQTRTFCVSVWPSRRKHTQRIIKSKSFWIYLCSFCLQHFHCWSVVVVSQVTPCGSTHGFIISLSLQLVMMSFLKKIRRCVVPSDSDSADPE